MRIRNTPIWQWNTAQLPKHIYLLTTNFLFIDNECCHNAFIASNLTMSCWVSKCVSDRNRYTNAIFILLSNNWTQQQHKHSRMHPCMRAICVYDCAVWRWRFDASYHLHNWDFRSVNNGGVRANILRDIRRSCPLGRRGAIWCTCDIIRHLPTDI